VICTVGSLVGLVGFMGFIVGAALRAIGGQEGGSIGAT
jgi:hypothetical protein